MENKIIEYKLLKDYPDIKAGAKIVPFKSTEKQFKNFNWCLEVDDNPLTNYYYTDKDLQNTDWFKPIYEEKYKEGDFVYWEINENSGIDKIIGITEDKNTYDVSISYFNKEDKIRIKSTQVLKNIVKRFATKEEINKVLKCIIKEYNLNTSDLYNMVKIVNNL